jgi:hypothetical protein
MKRIASEEPESSAASKRPRLDMSIDQNPSPASGTKQTGYSDLPQELRDMVCDELWSHTAQMRFHITSGNSAYYYVNYSPDKWPSEREWADHLGLPLWLLTNKAFLSDGLKQLRAHWDHSFTDTNLDDLPRGWCMLNPLINLSVATTLYVYAEARKREKEKNIYTDPFGYVKGAWSRLCAEFEVFGA